MKRTIGNATLYCADNLEQLQDLSLPVETAVVMDPPYGIGSKTQHQTARRSKFTAAHDWTPIEGDDMPFDLTPWLRFKWAAFFGADNFASQLPEGGGWYCRRVYQEEELEQLQDL